MASVTLRKSDKLYALNEMTRAKFQAKYARLMCRRAELAQRVYDDVFGDVGDKLKASTKDWAYWFETRDNLAITNVPVPGLKAEPLDKLQRNYYSWDLFSGQQRMDVLAPEYTSHSLKHTAVWPRSSYSNKLATDQASAKTKKVAATLTRDVNRFNKEVKGFYQEAQSILDHIRSTKKVDAMIPELWDYLPTGLRERVKQGIIPLSQADVDHLRKQLPKKKR